MVEYGETGFIPTITDVTWEDDMLVMKTLDGRRETDIVGIDDEPLQRRAATLSEEAQEALDLANWGG